MQDEKISRLRVNKVCLNTYVAIFSLPAGIPRPLGVKLDITMKALLDSDWLMNHENKMLIFPIWSRPVSNQ